MRQRIPVQPPLVPRFPNHAKAETLKVLSQILDEIPEAVELVYLELVVDSRNSAPVKQISAMHLAQLKILKKTYVRKMVLSGPNL